jgi:DNA glycosylase AlkZ-like
METAQSTRITLNELRALRMRAQCLAPRLPRKGLVNVVKRLSGVNAQLYSAMALSLRARIQNLSIEDVETSRVTDRAVVRTWCMRGTMHLLAADDIDRLLSAVSPAEIRGGWRWLEKRGGLEHPRAERVLDAAYRTLKANGAMTRRALMDAVAYKVGLDVSRAAAGVVQLNGLLGRVCFGPDDGADPTYVALDDWLGCKVKLSNQPDYGELARRYLRGYGPAAPRDFAAWWGLPLTQAKAAWASLEDELIELDVEGQPVWLLQSERSALKKVSWQDQVVLLLPAFDTYLLGYRNRDVAVPPKYQDRVFHGGEIAPTILIDGCAAGTWRYESRGKQIQIKATPFSSFTSHARDLIAMEADDIGRFFGRAAALSFTQ